MALYSNRIKRKEKMKKVKSNTSFFLKFLFFFLKSRYLSLPEFSKEIRNLTHEQLENRVTEIRYYQNDYNTEYESLKELFYIFTKEQNIDLEYSASAVFYGVLTMLRLDLNKYNDIVVTLEHEMFEDILEPYIMITRKEQ